MCGLSVWGYHFTQSQLSRLSLILKQTSDPATKPQQKQGGSEQSILPSDYGERAHLEHTVTWDTQTPAIHIPTYIHV